MNCDICDKSFTGLICFQQHEASEKHKNKVKLFQMRAANGTQKSPTASGSAIDSQIIRCDTCEVNFIGLSNFQKHVNSLQHVDMFKKKSESGAAEVQLNSIPGEPEYAFAKETNPGSCMPFNSPSVNLAAYAECKVCDKKFSGPEPYQQHLASENHKKKSIRNQLLNNKLNFDTVDGDKIVPSCMPFNSPSVNLSAYAECEVCDKQFSGPEPYQQHLASENHKKKVIRNQLLKNKLNFDTVDDDKIVPFFKQGNDTSVFKQEGDVSKNDTSVFKQEGDVSKNDTSVFKQEGNSATEPFAECSFCDMKFSGPEPYQLHVDSESHQRKVAISMNSSIQSSGNHKNGLGSYRCDVCDKDFSGPIPYDDHMISKVHKKKIQNMEFLKNIRSPTTLQSGSTSQIPDYLMQHINSDSVNEAFYCKVCKKQSTGPIPHQMHLVSEGHRKNARALEMESNLKAKRESLIQDHLEKELKKENLNELSREDQISSSKNNYNDKGNEVCKDFYISKDLILCDALKNIGVIPEEDLNVTIFYPDDKIVFA